MAAYVGELAPVPADDRAIAAAPNHSGEVLQAWAAKLRQATRKLDFLGQNGTALKFEVFVSG